MRVLLFLFAAAIAGCGDCVSIAFPAIEVTVLDSVTGLNITPGARAVGYRDGAIGDSSYVTGTANETGLSLFGSAGSYTVSVTKPGYVTWEAAGIVVERTRCSHTTVHVEARLKPNG
jgi:hypothetical protein